MEERNIKITLDKAKEWYNSGNSALKEIALQAFDENKLITNFKNITTFRKACDALDINYNTVSITINRIFEGILCFLLNTNEFPFLYTV